ncbi:two-component sensor protein RcsD [Klebsiella michiganensis]|nr:two-component sensor protein RcsD [Klebsiella michiganensis]
MNHDGQKCCWQANTLDERETFSSLRHLAWQNGYYFTLRTTFNQPGHLATVVAFDLPINDLIPPSMSLESFRLEPDPSQNVSANPDKETADIVSINFNGPQIEIITTINTTGMRLVWMVPFSELILESLQSIFTAAAAEHWPAGAGAVRIYHLPSLQRPQKHRRDGRFLGRQ